jgi:hypothetical protein
VHAAAWKQMFDDFLRALAQRTGEEFVPFDVKTDYGPYVDGKPRLDGTRGFLASRGITLPEGDPSDGPGAETVIGLATRKNELVHDKIRELGVEVYPGSVRYLHAVRDAGLKTAVVSSSANAELVLQAAGLADLVDHRVDGVVAKERRLPGKSHGGFGKRSGETGRSRNRRRAPGRLHNARRPHQALRLRPPRPTSPVAGPVHGRIRRRPILGGLVNEYEAAARTAGQTPWPCSGTPQATLGTRVSRSPATARCSPM